MRAGHSSVVILIGEEAVEQSRAAGALEAILATAPSAMRRVPGHHVAADFQPKAVVMANNRRPVVAALRPIAASGIAASGRIHALGVGARQNVVRVHWITATGDRLAFF